MHDRFVARIEEGLEKLNRTCEQRQGKNITQLIERRVGRLLQGNSRGAALFDIRVSYDAGRGRTVIDVDKNDSAAHWLRLIEGHYLLRTNITDWKPENLWQAYIHLTDAEEAFRIHKSEFVFARPLWHQKDDRIEAHIFVCFLAFVLWKTFGLLCKNAGLGDEPRRVFEEIKKICMMDVVLTTSEGKELKIRTVPRPDKPLQILLHRLGLQLPKGSQNEFCSENFFEKVTKFKQNHHFYQIVVELGLTPIESLSDGARESSGIAVAYCSVGIAPVLNAFYPELWMPDKKKKNRLEGCAFFYCFLS